MKLQSILESLDKLTTEELSSLKKEVALRLKSDPPPEGYLQLKLFHEKYHEILIKEMDINKEIDEEISDWQFFHQTKDDLRQHMTPSKFGTIPIDMDIVAINRVYYIKECKENLDIFKRIIKDLSVPKANREHARKMKRYEKRMAKENG